MFIIIRVNYIFFFAGKVSEDVLTEEEQLNDLLLLIKLLTNLLSKDILDFGSGQLTWLTVANSKMQFSRVESQRFQNTSGRVLRLEKGRRR